MLFFPIVLLSSRFRQQWPNGTRLHDTFQQTSVAAEHTTKRIDDEVKYVDTRSRLIVLETSN